MESDKLRLLHISDHHLLSDQRSQFAGIVPGDYFAAVLEDAYKASLALPQHKYDGIICSGDIVHDVDHNLEQMAQAYAIFKQQLERYFPDTPLYLCPGNHDDLTLFSQLDFNAPYALIAEKGITAVVLNAHWHLLLLNSKHENKVGGSITPAQLEALQAYLQEHSQVNVALVMHHNPTLINCAWLDSHKFRGIVDFWQGVQAYPNLKAIIHGHIHQDFVKAKQQVQILSVPSTSVQFKPNQDDFTLDPIGPGYRILTLTAQGIEQELKRLDLVLEYNHISGY
ncbi:hypothetical protein CJP74_04030 [Psittacicella melopsittaci]|uniref:Calcineurin-like phosphoesterase domain-containing protein n=1 Tax=Psittacicella melopsittaci TaxID=2028576 RepID=A0A3A1Y5C6_9GAMM|nr:metallophosphoesterase [Psittacicella melopsittaci]RIY32661.1 hypothetical protein CJP74_04030 [Psittacicella melopsittaci]